MSGRRRHEEEEHENHERWLVSYADMITLLAALFIVLFAMSSLDLEKFKKFAAVLRQDLGGEAAATTDEEIDPEELALGAGEGEGQGESPEEQAAEAQAAAAEQHALEQTKATIESRLQELGLQNAVRYRFEDRGLVVNIVSDLVLFDLGSDVLREDGRRVLDGLGPALASLPNQIAIEGHTDDRPITGARFPTNWELSTARATAVLRYLVDVHGLAPTRVYAAGYADQRPLLPNVDDASRDANRRVELVVIAEATTT